MLADRVNVARVRPQVAHFHQAGGVALSAKVGLALGGSEWPRRAWLFGCHRPSCRINSAVTIW
jgi:hypothetical protein